MSNTRKTMLAALGVNLLLLGVTVGYADWSGTGTGTCTDGEYEFYPFKEWEAQVMYDTTQTPWEPFFGGRWEDIDNDEAGRIHGNWYDPATPPQASNRRVSEGVWYREIYDAYVWGTYTINFMVDPYCVCSGTWTTTKAGWSGSGTISGSNPDCPPHE
jgi:hypothetical protein